MDLGHVSSDAIETNCRIGIFLASWSIHFDSESSNFFTQTIEKTSAIVVFVRKSQLCASKQIRATFQNIAICTKERIIDKRRFRQEIKIRNQDFLIDLVYLEQSYNKDDVLKDEFYFFTCTQFGCQWVKSAICEIKGKNYSVCSKERSVTFYLNLGRITCPFRWINEKTNALGIVENQRFTCPRRWIISSIWKSSFCSAS